MSLEEIKKLSDEDLHKRLADALGLFMRADFTYRDEKFLNPFTLYINGLCVNPFCSAEAENMTVDKVGHQKYSDAVHKVIFGGKREARYISHVRLMTPRQAAEACLLCLETAK